MKLYTAEQMRGADRAAMAAGVASSLLMEAAGRGVADLLRESWPAARSVLVLCGPGNNGGDGYVAARYLAMAGLHVQVLEMSSEPSSDDAERARAAYVALAPQAPDPFEMERVSGHLPHVDVVVDALLGSGLSRPLRGELVDVARLLTSSGATVLAVDVPTGVAADAAAPPGEHVRAAVTAQLAGPKVSSALEPARSAYGRSHVIDIGIPPDILASASSVTLLDRDRQPTPAPSRPADAHKYSVGTVLVVAGSERYLGAAELACRGAYRGGTGLVTLAAEGRLAGGWPEVVFEPIDWDAQPLETLRALESKRVGTVVIGPGLDPRAVRWLPDLLQIWDSPFVLDAGALVPSADLRTAVKAHGACLLTPHVGEAATLLDTSTRSVLDDPIGSARELADTFGALVALKGATTVIARADGRAAVCTTGHPGLATGGTGDVLAGFAGAQLAAVGQRDAGEPSRSTDQLAEAAERAVWRHGLAGERAAARFGVGLTASDVAEELARL